MNAPIRGSVFGYQVRSNLEFRYLRAGTAGSPLTVEEAPSKAPSEPRTLLPGSGPTKPDRGFVDVYSVGSTYAMEVDYAGWFHIDPLKPRIVVPSVPEADWREPLVWGLPTALCLMQRGDLVMHAAAVEVGGRALVFGAPGFHGKSTLSWALASRGFRVLSEDLTCIGLEDPLVVWPGPAVLRVRKDMAQAVPSRQGTTPVTEDDEKVHLALEKVGTGAAVPLGVVVFLRESQDFQIDRVPIDQAIPDLWRLGLNVPDDRGRADLLGKMTALLESVEVRNLRRPLMAEALDPTIHHLVSMAEE